MVPGTEWSNKASNFVLGKEAIPHPPFLSLEKHTGRARNIPRPQSANFEAAVSAEMSATVKISELIHYAFLSLNCLP